MVRSLIIADHHIGDDGDAFVIAELGHNHGGDVEVAKRMMTVAASTGASAVKLQKRSNRQLYTRQMYEQWYTSEHAYGLRYGEHREALEFGWGAYQALQGHANALGLIFFATAFDIPSANFLARLHVPCIKIASGDLTNLPLLEYCADIAPLIISTGGHPIEDVDRAYDWLRLRGAQFAFLQATAAYPCPHELLNLRVIETYRARYPNVVIGISDHNEGISMAPVAWQLGARIFEKHFTLNRAAKGSDNHFSLEPEPMRRMVNDLHGVQAALGDGVKCAYPSEYGPIRKMAKSLVAARDLPAGHVLTAEDIAIKSPGGGMEPYHLGELIGQTVSQGMRADELFLSVSTRLKERIRESV